MSDKIEIIKHPYVKFLNIFIVELTERSPHFHHDFELLLILSGQATLLCQGESLTLQTNDIILLNPNVTHEIHTVRDSITILCIQFSPKFFENSMPGLKSLFFEKRYLNPILSDEQIYHLQYLIIETAYQYVKQESTNQLISSSLLGILVSTLLNKIPWHLFTVEEKRANDLHRIRMEQIIAYVEDNYANKILLSDIAEKLGITTGYLSHFIKEHLNQSFQEYLTSVRFRHALLLLNQNRPLIDVCLECGFSNTRYLTNAFLKYQGCTPKEYLHMSISPINNQQDTSSSEYLYPPSKTLLALDKIRQPLGVIIDKIL